MGPQRTGEVVTGLFSGPVWFSFQVDNLLLVVMESAHLIIQRKAFQQSIEGLMTLRHEQTSSQPVIAKALQQLKVLTMPSWPLGVIDIGEVTWCEVMSLEGCEWLPVLLVRSCVRAYMKHFLGVSPNCRMGKDGNQWFPPSPGVGLRQDWLFSKVTTGI